MSSIFQKTIAAVLVSSTFASQQFAPPGAKSGAPAPVPSFLSSSTENNLSFCDNDGEYKVFFQNSEKHWQELCVHQHDDTDNSRCKQPGQHSEQHQAYVSVSPESAAGLTYPLHIKVLRKDHKEEGGLIRPRRLGEDAEDQAGINTYTWVKNGSEYLNGGKAATMEFIINRPCQLSIEMGDEDNWFPTAGSNANINHVRKINPLLIFANPALSELEPLKKIMSSPQKWEYIIIQGDEAIAKFVEEHAGEELLRRSGEVSMENPVLVGEDTILKLETQEQADAVTCNYFTFSGNSKSPVKCDLKTAAARTIKLHKNSGLYVGENVILKAMITSNSEGSFVYGYGTIITNTMRNSDNLTGEDGVGIVRLVGANSWISGPVLLDSAFRNIEVNDNGHVSWTKSMTGCGETDGVGASGDNFSNAKGITVTDSFFRVHDDVLKMYYDNSSYKNIVIWHTAQGRALMYSWGNEGEAQTIKQIRAENIYIIHDEQYYGWRGAYDSNDKHTTGSMKANDVAAYSSDNAYYSSIVGLYKQTQNSMQGMEIKGLFIESVVGMVLNVFNGFNRPMCNRENDPVTWFKGDICTGDVSFRLSSVSTKYMTNVAMGSSITGCEKNLANDVPGCPMTCGCGAEVEKYFNTKCGAQNQCRASVVLEYKDKPACNHQCIDLGVGPKGERQIINGCDCS